jgi:hypothetical protein
MAATNMRVTRLDVSFERRKAQYLENQRDRSLNEKENYLNGSLKKSPQKSLERIDENRY